MPLVSSLLETDVKNIFASMEPGFEKDSDGNITGVKEGKGDDDLATDLCSKIDSYTATALISGTLAGAVSAGAFVSITVTGTLKTSCDANTLKNLFTSMKDGSKGNDDLAEAIATVVDDAVNKNDFTINVSGTVTSPAGVPSPLAGTADGTWSGNKSTISNGLKDFFASMEPEFEKDSDGNITGVKEGKGDDDLATEIASLVTDYLTGGSITLSGSGVLSGASGSGNMS